MNIERVNEEATRKLLAARPTLVGIGLARDVIPGFEGRTILHAGPPIAWERMCGPMRGGAVGGILFEGWAEGPEEAERLAASGEVTYEPCHHHATVGPMAGIVTPSMPVFIVENKAHGNRAYCTLNEGLGKVLRYGAYAPEVLARLRWMADTLAPVLARALAAHGELDLKTMIAQALLMGDEGHNRNKAGTSLFLRQLAPALARSCEDREALAEVFAFIDGNDHFFLNLSMPAAKATADVIAGLEGCSLVSAMCRNGTDFGIRVAGLGDAWFVAPANRVRGLYFPGYSDADACPDIGDSVITETAGFGAFAMAAAPAIVQFVGGVPADAVAKTLRMYEITAAENDTYRIPTLDFRGTPTGIDIRKVVEFAIVPEINTGIAHKDPGVGQVGAGLTEAPAACFEQALERFVEAVGA